jgi:7-cyano-7-deazaguanine reductase
MPSEPSRDLVAIANPYPDRAYEVECVCPEFTCVCPMTGQPDFATFTISYTPGPKIVELKSLKLYLWSFRQEGHYHEAVTNRVLDDLVAALQPRQMRITSVWNVRGGITTTVRACYPPVQAIDTRRPAD